MPIPEEISKLNATIISSSGRERYNSIWRICELAERGIGDPSTIGCLNSLIEDKQLAHIDDSVGIALGRLAKIGIGDEASLPLLNRRLMSSAVSRAFGWLSAIDDLAGMGIADPNSVKAIGTNLVQQIMDKGTDWTPSSTDFNPASHVMALKALWEYGSSDMKWLVRRLEELTGSADTDVSKKALATLVELAGFGLGDKSFISVFNRFVETGDERTKAVAAHGIWRLGESNIGDVSSAKVLTPLLLCDDEDVRVQSVVAIGKLGKIGVGTVQTNLEPVLNLIRNGNDEDIKKGLTIISELNCFEAGNSSLIPFLNSMLADARVKDKQTVLGNLAGLAEQGHVSPSSISCLNSILRNGSALEKGLAANLISNLAVKWHGSRASLDLLEELLEAETSVASCMEEYYRADAAKAIGDLAAMNIFSASPVDRLLNQLKDNDPSVVRSAAYASLQLMKRGIHVDRLKEAVKEVSFTDDEETKRYIEEALSIVETKHG